MKSYLRLWAIVLAFVSFAGLSTIGFAQDMSNATTTTGNQAMSTGTGDNSTTAHHKKSKKGKRAPIKHKKVKKVTQ